MNAPLLVTGGTGNIGRRVVPLLREAGRDIRILSRHPRPAEPGIEHFEGDTVAGRGLAVALEGVDVVMHLAGGAKGDDVAARNLARAAREAGVRHLVLISVIGADRMPIGYFRAKAEAERVIAESGLPWTVLRAAQLHRLRAAGRANPVTDAAAPGARRPPVRAGRRRRRREEARGARTRRAGRPRRRSRRTRGAQRAAARRDVQGGDGCSAAAWSPADPPAWRCGSRVPCGREPRRRGCAARHTDVAGVPARTDGETCHVGDASTYCNLRVGEFAEGLHDLVRHSRLFGNVAAPVGATSPLAGVVADEPEEDERGHQADRRAADGDEEGALESLGTGDAWVDRPRSEQFCGARDGNTVDSTAKPSAPPIA